MGVRKIRRWAKKTHVLYDVKYLFARRSDRRAAVGLMKILVTGAAGFIGFFVSPRTARARR